MKRTFFIALGATLIAAGLSISCAGATAPTNDSGTTKSSDSTLASLSIKAGETAVSLSPAFAADTTTYTATVANTVASVTVTASATAKVATVTGTGDKTLTAGANAITVTVTAEDGTTKTYSVTVTRLTESSDATLKSLSVTDGTNAVSLTPSFSASTVSYSAYVDTTISSVTVSATTTVTGATVSGTGTVTLVDGSNAIALNVTAKDGTTKLTYTLTVNRQKLYSINGTVSFPSGSVIPTGNILSVGAQKTGAKDWAQNASMELTSATSYTYSIKNLPAGTYTINAYTHASWDDWKVYDYSACVNWAGPNVTIGDSDVSGKDFELTVPARTINITAPTITSSTFTVSGTWTGSTAPEVIGASFGGMEPVQCEVTGGTWTATIAASALASGPKKQLKIFGVWDTNDMNSFKYGYWACDFNYGVSGCSVTGTITLPARFTGYVNVYANVSGANDMITANVTLAEVSMTDATTCTYTLSGLIPGKAYVIGAYTYTDKNEYTDGTSYYNWSGYTFTPTTDTAATTFELKK